MAALIRYAAVNPYWNLPPEFNVNMVAPRVIEQGVGYLSERKYEVFADFTKTSDLTYGSAVLA